MTKSAVVQTRVEPELKDEAQAVLSELGLSTTEAVTMFLRQVVMTKSIPFPVRVPNAETIAAIEDGEQGNVVRFSGPNAVSDLMADLEDGSDS